MKPLINMIIYAALLLPGTIGYCEQTSAISGFSATWAIILLSLGILLLIMEIFIIPGFGVSGIMGILLLAFGIYMIVGDFVQSLLFIIPIIIVFITSVVYVLVNFHRTWIGKKVILHENEKSQEGFVSPTESDNLTGKKGTAISALRPSGRAQINEVEYNVMAQGVFIEPESQIEVIKVSGSNIYVKKIKQGDKE